MQLVVVLSELHGDRRCRRLQLLVQQAEVHSALVAPLGLSQGAVQLSLQVVHVPQPLLTVQPVKIDCSFIQRVHGQSCQLQICQDTKKQSLKGEIEELCYAVGLFWGEIIPG